MVREDSKEQRKGMKKAVKKKRPSGGDRAARFVGKSDVSIKGDGASSNKLDQEMVEKLVTKAKSHAQAQQAVKRAVFDIQLLLLDGVKSEAQLENSSALLTQSEYQDVVVERSIDKKCGYPLCAKHLLPESQRKGRFRISVTEHKIYDARETGLYCSQTCLIKSKTFALSLQAERDGLKLQEELAAIVRSVRNSKAQSSGVNGLNSTDQQRRWPTDSVVSEVKERQDTEIASFEDAGPSDSIEGYTPVNSIRDWRLKKEVQQQSSASAAAVLNNSALVPDAGNSTNSTGDGKLSPVKTSFVSGWTRVSDNSVLMPGSGNMDGSLQDVPMLKSVLKKSPSESTVKRSVSWGDQKGKGDLIQKAEPKVRQKSASKPRRQVKALPEPLKRETAAISSATVGSAVSATSSDRQTDEAGTTRDIAEAKASVFQGIERLSLAEHPLRSINETGYSEGKSNSAKPAHGDFDSVQGSPSIKTATRSTASISSCYDQIFTSQSKSDTKVVIDAEAEIAARLASAKDVAAALMEAAEATAAGDFESSEAVARAGLCILSTDKTRQNSVSTNSLKEDPVEIEEADRLALKWPQFEPQEEYDEEVSSSKAGWHDTAPNNFKLEISMFGTVWMALEEWISAATIAFVYGKEVQNEEEFLSVNGREYRLQVACEDGVSAEISRAFSNCIARVLPDVVQALGLRAPLSSLEQALGRMVRTMSFVESLPAFDVNHWRVLAMLFLEGLSVYQVDSIGVHLSKHSSLFRNLIISTGTSEAEYDTFRGLLLPSGRLP